MNEPPTISLAAPESDTLIEVSSLGMQVFVMVTDPNDLAKVEFFWWVESANSSLNTPLDSDVPVPNNENTAMVTKISLSQEFLRPYDDGALGLRVRDSFGGEVSVRWTIDVLESSQ